MENGHVTEVVNFNGGIKVMLQRWCLMEGAWSCYRENSGGRIVMLRRWPV